MQLPHSLAGKAPSVRFTGDLTTPAQPLRVRGKWKCHTIASLPRFPHALRLPIENSIKQFAIPSYKTLSLILGWISLLKNAFSRKKNWFHQILSQSAGHCDSLATFLIKRISMAKINFLEVWWTSRNHGLWKNQNKRCSKIHFPLPNSSSSTPVPGLHEIHRLQWNSVFNSDPTEAVASDAKKVDK